MNREELLSKWKEEIKESLESSRIRFTGHLLQQSGQLKDIILENLYKIKEKAAENEKEYIMFFYFSLLKADVLNQKYTILLQAMDSRWYLDEEMLEVEFSIDFLFQEFNLLWDHVRKESSKYIGKINEYDIRAVLMEELGIYNNAIAHALRYLFRDMEEEDVLKELPVLDYFIMRWGEYRDTTQIFVQIDKGERTQKEWNLELKKAKKETQDMANSYWCKGIFKNSQCENLMMQFITFRQCCLSEFQFLNSNLTAARFTGSEIKNSSFLNCDLTDADFRNTKLEEVSFEGCQMKNAIFQEADIPSLNLSEKQLEDILIERGAVDAVL